jgi:hypothetical protein
MGRLSLLISLRAGAATLVRGFIGYSQQEPSWSDLNRRYGAIERLRLYTDSDRPPNNTYLEVARRLALMTVDYDAVLAFAESFASSGLCFARASRAIMLTSPEECQIGPGRR